MTDVFEEVSEGVRRERFERLFRRFGPLVAAIVAIVLAGIGGWQLYKGWAVQQSRSEAGDFAAAQKLLHDGNADAAARAFAALEGKGPDVYRDLSRIEHAAALVAKGDLQGGLAGFDAAANAAHDPLVRDLTRLRAAYVAAETQDFTALQARLQPLIDGGGPVSYPARELLAVKAWESGRFDLARQTFQALADAFETPDSVRQRAQLGIEVLGPAAEAPAGAPASQKEAPRAPDSRVPGGKAK